MSYYVNSGIAGNLLVQLTGTQIPVDATFNQIATSTNANNAFVLPPYLKAGTQYVFVNNGAFQA